MSARHTPMDARAGSGAQDQAARQRVLRDQVQVGPACGDDKGFVEPLRQQPGGHTVGVVVVGVDQVEIEAFALQAFECG
jgi:hypothetical protein